MVAVAGDSDVARLPERGRVAQPVASVSSISANPRRLCVPQSTLLHLRKGLKVKEAMALEGSVSL
jgi:hypothetical protein